MDNPAKHVKGHLGAAQYMGVSLSTIWRWQKKGWIRVTRSPGQRAKHGVRCTYSTADLDYAKDKNANISRP